MFEERSDEFCRLCSDLSFHSRPFITLSNPYSLADVEANSHRPGRDVPVCHHELLVGCASCLSKLLLFGGMYTC